MRILHFADLHIGVENYGRTDPASGLSTRLQDFLAALDELVEYALTRDVDLVLFAGDAYKSRDPSQTQQREFARRIVRLTAGGVPVFLLVGNHDLPYAVGRASAVDIFPTLAVPGVTVGSELRTYTVDVGHASYVTGHASHVRGQASDDSGRMTHERLQIVAVPWISRSWLLTQDEYRGMGAQALNEVMEEKLSRLLAAEYERLDPSVPAVFAGHLAGSWAIPGSEKRMTIGADPIFLPATIYGSTISGAPGAVEYGALGHIHNHQVHDGRFPLVYSGSLQRVDFGEEGQPKGFMVIDIDPARLPGERLVGQEFVGVKAREFLTIEVACHTDNPTDEVLRAIERKTDAVRGAIVRVQVKLEAAQQAHFDESAVRRALGEAHYIAGVSRDVDAGERVRLQGVQVEDLTPLKALELYLKSKETPPERTKVLMEHAQRLLVSAVEGGGEGSGDHAAVA